MKYIASVSFGKDSLAMLLKLIELKWPLDTVVFYDSGMEFDAIYKLRDQITSMLQDAGIEYVELHPDEPFLYSMFEKKIKYKSREGYHYGFSWCGGVCRWHTRTKIKTINAYKKSLHEEVIDYVGIAADETERIAKNSGGDKSLPLVELCMTEADCLRYCRERGFRWMEHGKDGEVFDLYDILDRVSCWCCANKNLRELRNIYLHLPQYWERLKDLQSRTDRPMKSSGSIFELEHRFYKELLTKGQVDT